MKTIGQILRNGGGRVVRVAPDDSVLHALELMSQHDVGAVLVMEGDALLGILSERDYARKVALKGKLSDTTRAAEIMTAHVFCATIYMTIDQAMSLASERNVRHLPVVDMSQQVVGVISTRDLVREKLAQQTFVIEQLEQYIAA